MSNAPSPPQRNTKLDPHQLRRIAVVAFTDPRTVARVLAGGAVRSTTRARVLAAVEELRRIDAAAAGVDSGEGEKGPRRGL